MQHTDGGKPGNSAERMHETSVSLKEYPYSMLGREGDAWCLDPESNRDALFKGGGF